MAHLVVGTAGHIDHGKSALVHALTGVDPDRLKEEKRRGITIELGFADLRLDEDRTVSFVDVPGHERFVRHMVAGSTGVDAVVLVVAADQGVQPQTREHLEICELLGITRGLVALTKCDLVDPELADVVALELDELLGGSFLDGAPVIRVSAREGTGIVELRQGLSALFDGHEARPDAGVPRLPVDRSFVLRGFGTVVTGTLISGRLEEGAEVEILPGARRGRIRGLQVHRESVSAVSAGHRAAVNLQGLDRDEVPRGSTVTYPGLLETTRRIWARLRLLPSAPAGLHKGGTFRFHQGTADVAARLRVLETEDDGTLQVELFFRAEAVLAPGDRFILRRPAPVDTIGGGTVLDVRPPRPRERTGAAFELSAAEPAAAARLRLVRAGARGIVGLELAREIGVKPDECRRILDELAAEGRAVEAASRWFASETWSAAEAETIVRLKRFHTERPMEPGLSREALRRDVAGALPQESWRDLLERLAGRREIQLAGDEVRLIGHEVALSEAELELARTIEEQFSAAGLDPPSLEDVVPANERDRARPVVSWLIAEGKLVRIQDRRLFHGQALAALRSKLREYASRSRTIDVAGFKDLAGVTRKNAIPLLEQLDAERSTRRVGNQREILLS